MKHWMLAACTASLFVGCATGPHPALALAKQDLKCKEQLELHEIYPQKVRVEGCGKEAVYVEGCDKYGIDAECVWARHRPGH
ncbi:MAG: hypothetical protein OXU20_18960 [Myxococcales bacterium]|nr:hypothetical protein [Myxococcales bacterium]MDD9967786.1 hypothetical protein [Myxococcales bacterium]